VCLPKAYDDGGFSGATMDRPALQQLLADITAGRVDIGTGCRELSQISLNRTYLPRPTFVLPKSRILNGSRMEDLWLDK
jgi:hypothetical protein